MKKTKYFKVKTGFGRDDYLSITEEDVPRAIKAQITGKTFLSSAGTASGSNILGVVPDFNKELGLNRDYQLTGEDYREIGYKRLEEYRQYLENIKVEAHKALNSGASQKRIE